MGGTDLTRFATVVSSKSTAAHSSGRTTQGKESWIQVIRLKNGDSDVCARKKSNDEETRSKAKLQAPEKTANHSQQTNSYSTGTR